MAEDRIIETPEKIEEENRLGDLTIEEVLTLLDKVIDQLENGEGSLEEAFENYESGMKMVKSCNDKIERIEKQVLVLSGGKEEGDAGEF